ncbi:hypothetical protein [Gandjariella thermophila]|uniref:Uncharacterized protein n=1 Tax=Gandjariella thermophila TaxID=1931992 RepID=A0A4D4JBI1_9PSEU|nr:hypothetical protein [Gandjariella thermophila]GDY32380.1 hypothetical protein GTS_40130 [Gandjariella thermophila]
MDGNPRRIACRDQDGRRAELEVSALGDHRVGLRVPTGERYELEALEGVGRLRAGLRDKLIESALAKREYR